MQWTDETTVLSARKHGENSVVVRVLSHHHGVYAGVVKGAHSKNNRGLYQSGNILTTTWNARLSEHIGNLKGEMVEPTAALVMQDAMKLAALTSACALIETAMPERHPYPVLYKHLRIFLHHLLHAEDWQENYVKLELAILAESGFGLDLSECAATGSKDDLIYVSPKSGRAVSRDAGEPYKEKMLALPEFLSPSSLKGSEIPSPRRGEGQGGGADLIPFARELRRNQTDAEQKIWHHLRAHRFGQYGFRRQKPIGNYIADFICMEKQLIIELDGGQHAEQQEYDDKRTAFLESKGYKVLRFWNNDVLGNIDGVLETISNALDNNTPSLTLPRYAGEGTARPPATNTHQQTLAGLRLSGYFLEHWLLAPNGKKLPAARGRLLQTLKEAHGKELEYQD
ncbi:MAG: DNA repair protein RecO [Alphaproteobacteria bacterium]